MAGMWIYGAYLPKRVIFRIGLLVAIADCRRLLAVWYFPLVFRFASTQRAGWA